MVIELCGIECSAHMGVESIVWAFPGKLQKHLIRLSYFFRDLIRFIRRSLHMTGVERLFKVLI